jgi:hypothetical protein
MPQPASHATETGFVAEDSAVVRYIVRRTLEQHGCEMIDAFGERCSRAGRRLDRPVHLLRGLADLLDPHVTVARRESDAATSAADLSLHVTRAPAGRRLNREIRLDILGRHIRLDHS